MCSAINNRARPGCQVAQRVLKRAHALLLGARDRTRLLLILTVGLSRICNKYASQRLGRGRLEVLEGGECWCLYWVEEPHLFPVFPTDTTDVRGKSRAQRTLVLAGLAHALHDGFTNMIYLLLPVWQAQFAPGYAALAELRALNVGAASVGWKAIEVRTAIFF
jgi:hypothetical protein